MFETYEEKVGKALDTLYPGALFLAAGDQAQAERLVVDTVTGALRSDVETADISTKWFEGQMAKRFLERNPSPDTIRQPAHPSGSVKEIDAAQLLEGVAFVPGWSRAALWLVLLRQWSYAEVRDALDVSTESLSEMLQYRTMLARGILGATGGLEEGASAR